MFHAERLTDNAVLDEFHSHFGKVVNLHIHHFVGQAELRNAVFQYTANLMQCFENGNVIAILCHISGKRQTGGTRTNDGNFDAVLFLDFRYGDLPALPFVIGGKAFQITDSYRLLVHLQVYTFGFTLLFLRTDATADGRQCTGFFQCLGRFEEFSALNVLDEAGDVDTYGTAFRAARISTVQATLGFGQCLLFR